MAGSTEEARVYNVEDYVADVICKALAGGAGGGGGQRV